MIQMYRSFLGTEKIQELESGCWIHCVQPDSEEVNILQEEYKVPQDVIQDILDNDERPRYEVDDDWSMIILRIPGDAEDYHAPIVVHFVTRSLVVIEDVLDDVLRHFVLLLKNVDFLAVGLDTVNPASAFEFLDLLSTQEASVHLNHCLIPPIV